MLTETVIKLFNRNLVTLKLEINLYQNGRNLWLTRDTIKNYGGNLCLHLIGNLNNFIGREIGNTGDISNDN